MMQQMERPGAGMQMNKPDRSGPGAGMQMQQMERPGAGMQMEQP